MTNNESHELVLVANSAGDVVIWLIVVGASAQLFGCVLSQSADDSQDIKVVVLRVIRIQNPIISATPFQRQRNEAIDVVTRFLQERDGLAVKLRIFLDVLIVPFAQAVEQIRALLQMMNERPQIVAVLLAIACYFVEVPYRRLL